MASRPLIQYDDLDAPPTTMPRLPQRTYSAPRPPAKKRKRLNYQQRQQQQRCKVPKPVGPAFGPPQHWDDPGTAAHGVVYDDQEGSGTVVAGSRPFGASYAEGEEGGEGEGYGEEREEEEEGEEEEYSRPLTQEEIWDDAALVDAWNAAEAEYEAYHGSSKSWKTDPVKKSPLWYNKPYTTPQPGPSKSKPKATGALLQPQARAQDDDEDDTAPLDFDTYVPTHDPSLGIPKISSTSNVNAGVGANHIPDAPFFPPASMSSVSRDQAFHNALSSMYWSGYWTAVYQCQSQSNEQSGQVTPEENGIEANESEGEGEDLVSTQR